MTILKPEKNAVCHFLSTSVSFGGTAAFCEVDSNVLAESPKKRRVASVLCVTSFQKWEHQYSKAG